MKISSASSGPTHDRISQFFQFLRSSVPQTGWYDRWPGTIQGLARNNNENMPAPIRGPAKNVRQQAHRLRYLADAGHKSIVRVRTTVGHELNTDASNCWRAGRRQGTVTRG
jgi:hypothetical protein